MLSGYVLSASQICVWLFLQYMLYEQFIPLLSRNNSINKTRHLAIQIKVGFWNLKVDVQRKTQLPLLITSKLFNKSAAAAAKSLQSCPTLCDPRDGSPPGSPVPEILQQEHWSGLPFPSPMHESEKWKASRSVVSNSLRPHGLQPAYQAPLSMGVAQSNSNCPKLQ